ncbi:uncharacterized protein LOC141910064 [Tubulanus polymorphus]|uniref:uncharacterized protein LOC141910064 n=1 Tax=Tubulanus polymorphus TaxID=672921 RepID=UPI003DA66F12
MAKIPCEAACNNLQLDRVPRELSHLNPLEEHLIAINIPFIKMIALPRQGQHGCHGPVVCVPSDVKKTTTILPRDSSDDQMMKVKLKRKLTYKGHYQYQFVDQKKIMDALTTLKSINKHYRDIELNQDWTNCLEKIDEESESEVLSTDKSSSNIDESCVNSLPTAKSEADKETNGTDSQEETEAENLHEMYMNSCLQPIDIGQEILDAHFNDILCLAPAENNSPIQILTDKENEAKSFPTLFPTGRFTYHAVRDERITLARYLHTRLMNADPRFSRNTDFIFYSQFLSEINQVASNVSIALRKGVKDSTRQFHVGLDSLRNLKDVNDIFKYNDGYKFLKPIRGTPPFWQAAQKDLLAMVRQLGVPTFFVSFSAAEMRWNEHLEAIMRIDGCNKPVSELSWSEKCGILRRNPVTAARMFDHRFHTFLNDVIKSPAQPIGEIQDFFYRVEFQMRGSPHVHALIWVKDAPKSGIDDDANVTSFVDRYITCKLPDDSEDPELHETEPPPPPSTDESNNEEPLNEQIEAASNAMSPDQAKEILQKVWELMNKEDTDLSTTESLYISIGITQDMFEEAYRCLSRKSSVVLKREPNECWVNQYNPALLRAWQANMDIQYVTDAFACVVYIVSYISKSEREMGLLLEHTRAEAADNNQSAKQAMKSLGSTYLHNREVSAQEAVYRVCNLKMKQGSRKVQFIPTGDNIIKLSKPLSVLQSKSADHDLTDDDVWMTGIVERYQNRPDDEEFEQMCLAQFCSEYRILAKSQVNNSSIALKNESGYIRKRTNTAPAVVRYARFSKTKQPEKHYQTSLQLFLPYRQDEQLKPPGFETFEVFYETGHVCLGSAPLTAVKHIVDKHRSWFEADIETFDMAQEMLNTNDEYEDAWAQIAPECEHERHEAIAESQPNTHDDNENDPNDIPDLQYTAEKKSPGNYAIENSNAALSKDAAWKLIRSLNNQQKEVFYKLRQWCIDIRNGHNPKPFHIFLTGGAGTGKSHLIKAIKYEASRILAPTAENPDDVTVCLTAPTGVAAYNIGATTIHNTFAINIGAKLPYVPLSDDKISELRVKFNSLQIVIIDEISMVDHKMLGYVHGRLRQIKQCPDYSPFGNVSVIAVGDFYQLPPVKGKPLYSPPDNGVDLWSNVFEIVELQEIMRQKGGEFAAMLNRLRSKKKEDMLSDTDDATLKARVTGETNATALGIYSTNKQVDDVNTAMLTENCTNIVEIAAHDLTKDPRTGRLIKKVNYHISNKSLSLAKSLLLAYNARVMLTKNINVSDGLVNGVLGTVSHISFDDDMECTTIYVIFDDKKIGKELRNTSNVSNVPENSTPIVRVEESAMKNKGVRRQFPLKLAWACTVHKVQGVTAQNAVVSLKKIFSPGQADVALSRVTSIEGLILEDYSPKAIFCNELIKPSVENMTPFIQTENDLCNDCTLTMALHNTEGLPAHYNDIANDERLSGIDYICVTETWLTDDHNSVDIQGYNFHHQTRSMSYDIDHEMVTQIHGGVGIYAKLTSDYDQIPLQTKNIECMAIKDHKSGIAFAVIYRPPSYNVTPFKIALRDVICEIRSHSDQIAIVGDFNENVLVSSSVANMLETFGYVQCVTMPTTNAGTLVDHVYVTGFARPHIHIVPTFYSHHDIVSLGFH